MTHRAPRPIPGVGAPDGRHGLTSAEVEHQLRVQAYTCLICREPLGKAWAVDHSHELAELHGHDPKRGCIRCFRGLLCRACNLMLGFARDDPEVLERGAAYIRAADEASSRRG